MIVLAYYIIPSRYKIKVLSVKTSLKFVILY